MEHIKHLKKHRNILYSLVVFLLVLQILTFVIVSINLSTIKSNQEQLREEFTNSLKLSDEKNNNNLNDVQAQLQGNINEISGQLIQQKNDFSGQIKLLQASQNDFSGVINDVIKGVVSISTERSAGTGFIIHSGGYIVTNEHVIAGSNSIRILTYGGKVYQAQIIGEDSQNDIALLKINGIFDHINLGDSQKVQVGEKVIAIGNPLGLSFTVTEGIVSAVHRDGPSGNGQYIQTDVTLNPGNSGGPLIDKQGNVIGINNFKIGNAEGLGFALESSVIKNVVNGMVNQTLIEYA